jgi:protein-S-isoprenylcysteine O-methyltransferase Ste14
MKCNLYFKVPQTPPWELSSGSDSARDVAIVKKSRIRKLTWKLLVVYVAAILLVGIADPDPGKYLHWWFWPAMGLLAGGLSLRIWAAGHLQKNQVLTVTGPYAYVKNPLYVGTFLCLSGLCVLAQGSSENPSWPLRYANWILFGAGLLIFILYYVPYKKKREGDRLLRNFGEAWSHYDQSVPGYFPKLRRYDRASSIGWEGAKVVENSELWTTAAVSLLAAAILFNGSLLRLIGL